jgi:superoxide dismutase
VFNNAAQARNNNFYWSSLSPAATAPSPKLQATIERKLGSIEALSKVLGTTSASQSGPRLGMAWAAVTRSYGKLPALLKRLRERLKQLPNEKRPGRTCARAVKSRPFRYTVRVLKKDLN